MPKRRTKEDFENQLKQINKNIELVSDYKDSHSKILVRCKICKYEWTTIPGNLLYKKTSCPQCVGIHVTTESFKKKIFNVVGNEYSVLSEYIDANIPIKFKHNKCGTIFKMKPRSFFISKTKCSNKDCKHNIYMQNNLKKFNEKIFNLGFTVVSNYTGIDDETTFKCNKCNNIFTLKKASKILEPVATSHCPHCSNILSLQFTSENYEKRFSNKYGNEFKLASKYIGADLPIKILHKKCGNISEYPKASRVISNYFCPCKYCNITNGEKKIIDFLQKHNITYEYQKRFSDLRGVNNGKLSYDFYIPTIKLLIEFNGKQHYTDIEYFGGEKYFEIQQEHDNIKREYANNNNIRLIEIPYWEFENIEEILLRELGIVA